MALSTMTPLAITALRVIAAMPEPQRRAYVHSQFLPTLDSETQAFITRALPTEAADAFDRFMSALREWK